MISLLLLAGSLSTCPRVVKDVTLATCYDFPPFNALSAVREGADMGPVRFAYRMPLRTSTRHLVLLVDCLETELSRQEYLRADEGSWQKTADSASVAPEDFLAQVHEELDRFEFSRCKLGGF